MGLILGKVDRRLYGQYFEYMWKDRDNFFVHMVYGCHCLVGYWDDVSDKVYFK